MVWVLAPQVWQPLGLAQAWLLWESEICCSSLTCWSLTRLISDRRSAWEPRAGSEFEVGCIWKTILRHQAPINSRKHCGISTKGIVKVSSAGTVISMLTVLKKRYFLCGHGGKQPPKQHFCCYWCHYGCQCEKVLYCSDSDPVSVISSSLLLIQKLFKGQVGCASIHTLICSQEDFMVVSMPQLQFSKVFRPMLD